MSANWHRKRINPRDVINTIYKSNTYAQHIHYDKSVTFRNKEYFRCKQMSSDSTFQLLYEMMEDLLRPLIMQTSYCKTSIANMNKIVDETTRIDYFVGDIRHVWIYGDRVLEGKLPGIIERVRMPIRCEYSF